MFLSFLTILGGALLTTSTIDVWIGENYKTGTQTVYLAEAALEDAREYLRTLTASTVLDAAAGINNVISVSTDLTILLASDDQPLLPADSGDRTVGKTLTDPTGRVVGTFHVWLRNDVAEGMTTITDSNGVLNLLAIARIGSGRKVIEMTVKKGRFPQMPAALTLNGDPVNFSTADSDSYEIDGNDAGSANVDENSIGVISTSSVLMALAAIPDSRENHYMGVGNQTPPPADIGNISGKLDPQLTTVSGLESIANRVSASATDRYDPPYNGSQTIGNIGSGADYRVVVVNGNCTFGPGTGYGILLVRGNLTFSGNFSWSGLVLVIGQGVIRWNSGGNGAINGGMFLASTRNADQSATDPYGTLRPSRGPVTADFKGAGGNGIQYNTTTIEAANSSFPYNPIAYREY